MALTHGAFSDRRACMPLARHFAQLGRTVYIVEWRGRRRGPGEGFGYADVALNEIAAAASFVAEEAGTPAHWLAHSGGGLMAALMLAERPACGGRWRR